MSSYIYLIGFCLFLASCNNTPKEIVKENNPIFKTSDPSRLYFTNTRSHKYRSVRQRDTQIDYYYLKASEAEQIVYPVIADNWLSQEAYILLKSERLSSTVWELKKDTGESRSQAVSTRKDQYELAIELYKNLEKDEKLMIEDEAGNWQTLFESDKAKADFKRVMSDYFLLLESSKK